MPPLRGDSTIKPPFPFVSNVTDDTPRTPMQKSRRLHPYDAEQTHPVDSPFLPSPFSGFCFKKSGRKLSREGALISEFPFMSTKPDLEAPTFGSPQGVVDYHEVERVIKPNIGIFTGSTFRPIRLGRGRDVELEFFDPDLYPSCWTVRRNANGSGVTQEDLRKLCVQCFHCKNIVSRTSHGWHKCPGSNCDAYSKPEYTASEIDVLEEVKYRLDAVGKGHFLNGLTREEFEGYFSVCIGCDLFLTPDGREEHVCSKSFMIQSLNYEGEDDDGSESDGS